MSEFISDDDLQTFDGWLRYQQVDPAQLTSEQLVQWRGYFEEDKRAYEATPKVGLMKLRPVSGEQRCAVAIRDQANLWLTMWVRSNLKGEIFIMYPGGESRGDAHASYHLDGTFHQKSYGGKRMVQKRQPLTGQFKCSEHLGIYGGHGKSTGAECDPKAFYGLVTVEPGILGPMHGDVGFDLIEPGYEATWEHDIAPQFYFVKLEQRQIFLRTGRPSLAITITIGR